jgi:hypothetical protein
MADPSRDSNTDHGQPTRTHHRGLRDRAITGLLKKRHKKVSAEAKAKKPWDYEQDGKTRSHFSLWTLIPIIMAAIIGIGGVFYAINNEANTADAPPPPPAPIQNEDIEPVFTQPPLEIAEAFIASTNPQQRLQWVRNPEDVAKRMLLYPEEALSHPVENLIPMSSASAGDMIFARFIASFTNGNKRLLCVLATQEGPKVDWDAYARFGDKSWPSILEGNSGPAEVRVFLKRGYYYTYSYRDDTLWQCYQITSPDIQETIYVYARSDSKGGQLLASTFPEGSTQMQRMALTISSTEDGLKHGQFNIDRIHAIGWVRGDKDIEDVWISSPLNEPEKKSGEIPDLGPPAK